MKQPEWCSLAERLPVFCFFLLQRGTEWDTKAAASSPDMQGRVLCLRSCRATCPAGKPFPRKREKRRSQAPLTPDTGFGVRYAFLGHVIIHRLNRAADYWSDFYYCYREQTCRLLLDAFGGLDSSFWKTARRSTQISYHKPPGSSCIFKGPRLFPFLDVYFSSGTSVEQPNMKNDQTNWIDLWEMAHSALCLQHPTKSYVSASD